LSGPHDREAFDCGEASLNDWLTRMAWQQQRKRYARTHVLVDDASPKRILGFHTLLAYQVDTTHFPSDRKLPRTLPAVLLARLAVDRSQQGRGLGELLLADAVSRAARLSDEVAAVGIVVDALNDSAVRFYEHFGFEAFEDDPRRLVLMLL
jgi:GNAT superfamily N-acetyltransferase